MDPVEFVCISCIQEGFGVVLLLKNTPKHDQKWKYTNEIMIMSHFWISSVALLLRTAYYCAPHLTACKQTHVLITCCYIAFVLRL